jgi:hypothetical protein
MHGRKDGWKQKYQQQQQAARFNIVMEGDAFVPERKNAVAREASLVTGDFIDL